VALKATIEKTPTTIEEKQLQSMSQLLADIIMHENRANTRMWGRRSN